MRSLSSTIALMSVLQLSGCGGDSAAAPQNALTIDCAIEIQIAVVSGWTPEEDLNSGNWRVAAAWVFPVQSMGPGHVVCDSDGAILEFEWSDVSLTHDGTCIGFGDCRWAIRNRIDRRDGVSQTIGGHLLDGKEIFETYFMPLASCELDTMLDDDELREQSDRRLVIRGRLLQDAPPVQPLSLAELTESL